VGKVSPSDSILAAAVRGAQFIDCPQTLIDMMPSAGEYLARLTGLANEFKGADDMVAYLCGCDVHAASTTIN
jgi:hypothetical protein